MAATFKETLPAELVTHVSAICGDRGERWFEELPGIIRDLEQRWSVSSGPPFPGIEFNYVAPAQRGDGGHVVIKMAPPFERIEIHNEARYLRELDGSGAARLLAEAHELSAIMIERVLPGEPMFQVFKDDPISCVEPAIKLLKGNLRQPPSNLKDVELLDNWFLRFRRYKDTDFPARHAEKALKIYDRLSPDRTCYLHGDFHPGNILSAERDPFLVIDPKGIVGHPGYDVAVFLNNLHWWQKNKNGTEELLNEAVERFARALNLSEREIREWSYACMVISAWWKFEDMPEHYDETVAISDIWNV